MDNERQTGATDAQIEAAAERRYNFLMTGYPNKTHMTGMGKTWDIDAKRRRLIGQMTVHARYLVPPGQVITDAARLPTAEELAAMEVLSLVSDRVGMWHWQCEVVRAYLERQR